MTYCEEKISIDSLIKLFTDGFKKESLLGIEYERLPVYKNNYNTVSYYGDFGIKNILKEFACEDNWDYILSDNEIIGLKKLHDTITLEPGSQVELSLEPQKTIKDIKIKIDEINSVLLPVLEKYNLKLINYGIYPKTTHKNIRIIPKERYNIMAKYLWGILSDVMMRETAGIQIGIDFKNEEDAFEKFNLANKMSPFITAMFANSSIRGGVNTGYKSFRALAWLNTDNERCGIATKFNKEMSFKDYINILFKVPVIYIARGGKYININGKIDFKTFVESGYEGFQATIDDFKLHSNLFFPDVRLRKFIEIRNHDCVEEEYLYSILAIYKAILYNSNAMKEIDNLLNQFSYKDILEIRYKVPRLALETPVKNYTLKDITQEILKICESSLKNDSDKDFLNPIIELNSKGLTPNDIAQIKYL